MLRAFTVVVFLVIGAGLNVAVAWIAKARSATVSVELIEAPGAELRPPARMKATGPFRARQRAEGFGRTNYWYLAPGRSSTQDLGRFQAGWPMRSLECWTGPVQDQWQLTFDDDANVPKWAKGTPLPLYPLWLGFAVNSMIWGGAIPPLVLAARRVRGLIRRRRGQCTRCGYPVGSSPVCTECGREVG